MTSVIVHPQSGLNLTTKNADSVVDVNRDTKQTVFFRFVHGKTLTLTVSPNIEILALKQMLLHKVALFNAAATATSGSDSTVVSTVLGLFWLSSFLTPKLHEQDLSFIYRGKPMEDDMSVNTYIPQSSSNPTTTIHVSVRLYGGCFMVSATVLGLIMTAIVGSTCTCGLSLIAVPFLLPLLFILPFFCL